MVVRDEPDGIRRYTHIGTGNYNPKTSRLYEDLGLITTDEAIGEDVAHLFNNLSGWSRNASYDQLLVAPDSVRTGLVEQIHREIAHHQAGRPALIRIKANSVVDEAVIDALYLASQAGVQVRDAGPRASARCGPACPACPRRSRCARCSAGSSSTAGSSGSRTAATPEAWIGSADMMHRNLDRRVEVLVRLPGEENVERDRRAARPRRSPRTPAPGSWTATATGAATRAPSTCRRPDRARSAGGGDLSRLSRTGSHARSRPPPSMIAFASSSPGVIRGFRFRPVDTSFYDLFTEQAQHLVTGAALLAEMLAEGADHNDVARRMREAEHNADETTHAIVSR